MWACSDCHFTRIGPTLYCDLCTAWLMMRPWASRHHDRADRASTWRRNLRLAACTTSLTSLMSRLICWLVRSSSFSWRWRLSRKCGLSARHSVNSSGCRPTPMAAAGWPQLGAMPPSSATFTARPHSGPSHAYTHTHTKHELSDSCYQTKINLTLHNTLCFFDKSTKNNIFKSHGQTHLLRSCQKLTDIFWHLR